MASGDDIHPRNGSRSAASFWKGVVAGIAAMLIVLALIAGTCFLVMGRCPMCGRMMVDDMLDDPMMNAPAERPGQ